ncbi:MAG: hypothetical protein Q8939_03650 [Bacteroidota bacterium]|nr:hypothetical protein [Bacteroidota bacterium]
MKFQLFEIEGLSGEKTKIYSPMMEGGSVTLFEKFLEENNPAYPDEVTNLYDRLEIIGNETGLWDAAFDSRSGRYGTNICTLKDLPDRFLRLFFIEFGNTCIVLGSGGEKPKHVKARQEVPKLNDEVELLERISLILQKALKEGRFTIEDDGFIVDNEDLDLIFNI